jgi:hypothetical protein
MHRAFADQPALTSVVVVTGSLLILAPLRTWRIGFRVQLPFRRGDLFLLSALKADVALAIVIRAALLINVLDQFGR